jgi:hypothetical protein
MTTLLAYVWTPVLMTLLALGLGLLLDRACRLELPSALLAPVGVAAAIPLTTTIYRLQGTGVLAAIVVVAGAVAGFILARRDLRARLRPGWAAAAALAAGLLYLGPYLVTASWTWGGYNFVNDTSVNLIYVDLLKHHGFTEMPQPWSTTTRMQTIGVQLHYPMGAHGLLATLWPLAGIDAAPLYQPYIAGIAAAAAAALVQLARRAGAPDPVAAVIAVVAIGSNLVYRYSQHGAIKEILMVMLVVAATAVVAEALAGRVHAGYGVMLGLCLASMFLVFSVAGAPYAVLIAVLAAVALLFVPLRPKLRQLGIAAAAGAVTAVVATAAVIGDVISFGQGAATTFESGGANSVSTAQFGHLLRPMPAYQAAGVWLGDDYRLPLAPGGTQRIQTALIVLVLALAVVGVAVQLWRRRFAAPLLFAACALTAVLAAPRVGPYADAKLLLLLSTPIVLLAGLALWELRKVRVRGTAIVAALLGLACGGGILWSDALAAHETRLAPVDRLGALEDAAAHAGDGYWLINEWEEYAKYFARSIRTNSGSESDAPDVVVLRNPGPIFGQYFDLDEQALEYLQRFNGIVVRRSPVASRPPGDFRRVYANDFYELWRRDPAVRVREHLPLGDERDASAIPECADVRRLVRRARRRGDELLAARRPPLPSMDVISPRDRPLGWVPEPNRPGMVSLNTPGRESGVIRVSEGGRYRVWLQLSSGRPMQVRIDGRLIGSPRQVNGPEQWLEVGDVTLAAGDHQVELRRRGGRPIPGDGYNGELGPLALVPGGDEQTLERLDPATVIDLCTERWDWIEAVDQ